MESHDGRRVNLLVSKVTRTTRHISYSLFPSFIPQYHLFMMQTFHIDPGILIFLPTHPFPFFQWNHIQVGIEEGRPLGVSHWLPHRPFALEF